MKYIYKTIYFQGNTKAEYQRRGNQWYKRKKGSADEFYAVDTDGAKTLENAFKDKGNLYFYSDTFKIGVGLAIGGIVYLLYRRTMNQVGASQKPLNIANKPNVTGKPTT